MQPFTGSLCAFAVAHPDPRWQIGRLIAKATLALDLLLSAPFRPPLSKQLMSFCARSRHLALGRCGFSEGAINACPTYVQRLSDLCWSDPFGS